MKILTLCGSARPQSSNRLLLNALVHLWSEDEVVFYDIHQLPLFADVPDRDRSNILGDFKVAVSAADAIIIATPEYAHNLPAALKNALEWLVRDGEAAGKPVLPITLTPHAPRGENCMQSLCWTLAALNCRIVSKVDLYRDDLVYDEQGRLIDCLGRETLVAARALF
ncbi:NAD(P)H-dependent oxidoreductase [Lewinellaceae bacterium SD302]|nr:NAD(P)H-dependent oxidoreductase [Lewinellaceae bacterium SD302]